jgi:hypothetical protein
MITGVADRETSELGKKALHFAMKALSLGCSLQYWASMGSCQGGYHFYMEVRQIRAYFSRAVIMWWGSIHETELVTFWLVH